MYINRTNIEPAIKIYINEIPKFDTYKDMLNWIISWNNGVLNEFYNTGKVAYIGYVKGTQIDGITLRVVYKTKDNPYTEFYETNINQNTDDIPSKLLNIDALKHISIFVFPTTNNQYYKFITDELSHQHNMINHNNQYYKPVMGTLSDYVKAFDIIPTLSNEHIKKALSFNKIYSSGGGSSPILKLPFQYRMFSFAVSCTPVTNSVPP